MKKIYSEPNMKIKLFMTDCVVTTSNVQPGQVTSTDTVLGANLEANAVKHSLDFMDFTF